MYQNGGFGGAEFFGLGTLSLLGVIPLLLWSLAWKGWALWLAARRGEMVWFVILLVVNTLGLLEIFYIFAIAKQQDKKPATPETAGSAEGPKEQSVSKAESAESP